MVRRTYDFVLLDAVACMIILLCYIYPTYFHHSYPCTLQFKRSWCIEDPRTTCSSQSHSSCCQVVIWNSPSCFMPTDMFYCHSFLYTLDINRSGSTEYPPVLYTQVSHMLVVKLQSQRTLHFYVHEEFHYQFHKLY